MNDHLTQMELPLDNGSWIRLRCGHSATAFDRHSRCLECDLRLMPVNLKLLRTSPTWSDETVPAGLRSAHSTSAWACLVVETGSVEFVEAATNYKTIATPSNPVTIVPFAKHLIKPHEGAQFAIAFYK